MGRLIALVFAFVAGALIAWSQLRLPAAAPANAPAVRFSAVRALSDVRLIASRPHPIGSAANHVVRDRLLGRLTALGFAPRVQRYDALLLTGGGGEGATAETLIGVLPGRDHAKPALALMAHYDSVPGAPGAADDGAGVAAALEAVRAIRARGVPARDVAVILTDGEEAGLLGARGFFANDPLAAHLGFVLNMEARGSGGRVQMFETGRDNGAAMGVFRRTAVRPSAGSLFGAVYARLPNDTDFSISRRRGIAGFNYAFTGRSFDYHSPTDTPANLQAGALQDMGDQVLAAAAALAFTPALPARSPDVVYGVLFGRAMLAYPPARGWLVLAAAAALLAAGVVRARRAGALPWSDLARGAGAGLYALTGAAAVLHLARAAAVPGEGVLGPRRLLAAADRWETALILLAAGYLLFAAAEAARGRRTPAALVPLAAGLASCALAQGLDAVGLGSGLAAAVLALAIGGQPVGRPGGWAGVLLLGLIAATAVQAAAPLTAYVLAWPLVLGALAAAATALAADRRPGRLSTLTLIASVGLGWGGVHAHLIVDVVGLPELLCLPLLMAAVVAWPLAQPDVGAPPARLAGRALLVAGAAMIVLVRLAAPWDARHPQPSFVAYQLDQDAGRAWRIAQPQWRTAWSDHVLQADGGRIAPLSHWAWPGPVDAAPARVAAVPPPIITLSRAPDGLVALTVIPPPGARTLALQFNPDTPARLVRAGQAGAGAPLPPGRWTRLNWSAPAADGLRLAIRPGGPGSIQLRYVVSFDHWPAGVAPPGPPPPAVMALGRSGEALATGSRSLAW